MFSTYGRERIIQSFSMKKIRVLLLMALGILMVYGCSSPHTKADNLNHTRIDVYVEEGEEKAVCSDTVSLIFFGDAMQHRRQLERARLLGTKESPYDFSGYYDLISPAIKEVDYAIVNLEVALGGLNDYSGYPKFSAPDLFAMELKNAGFDLLLTANNHILDRGDRGLRRTLAVLDSIGVDHIGTYSDLADRNRKIPFIKEINGIKIGFLNYTYGTNGIKATRGAEVAYIERDKIKQELEATRRAGAEFIIVLPHWGDEYILTENKTQKSLAEYMLASGADMIVGGHPHVPQPMKIFTDSLTGNRNLVVYSLGNFISDMKTADTRGGVFVRVVLEKDENGKVRLREAEYDTFLTETPSVKGTNYRVVPSWRMENLPADQKYRWDKFNSSIQNLYDRQNIDVPRSLRKF